MNFNFNQALADKGRRADEELAIGRFDAQTRRIAALNGNPSSGGGGGGMAIPPPPAATPTFLSSPSAPVISGAEPTPEVENYMKSAKPFLYGGMVRDPNGSPKKDTVPAKLADKEAVLNAPAAAFLGEELIAKLNQMGKKAMGMPDNAEAQMVDGELHAVVGLTPFERTLLAGKNPNVIQMGGGGIGPNGYAAGVQRPVVDTAARVGTLGKLATGVGMMMYSPNAGDASEDAMFAPGGKMRMAAQAQKEVAPTATQPPKAAAPAQPPKAVAPVAPFASLPANATQDQRSNYSLAERGMSNIVRKGNTYTNMGAVNPYATQRFREQDGLTGNEIAARNKTQQDAAYKAAMDTRATARDEWLRTYHPAEFAQLQAQKFAEAEAPINRAHELKKQEVAATSAKEVAQISAGGKAAPKFATRKVADPKTGIITEQLYEERTGLSQAQYAANQAIQAQLQNKPSGQYTIVVAGKPMRVQYNAETDSVTPVN